MGKAVDLTWTELSADSLRLAASRCSDANATRRMLAIAMVLEGASRAEAARCCGMDRQTLRDWVVRYNQSGVAGLYDNKQTPRGPKPRLSAQDRQTLAQIVRQGPDQAEHGVVRWRRVDLAKVIEAKFHVTLGERMVGTILRGLGFRRLSARPQHPKQDAEAMQAHKKTLPIWSPRSSPSTHVANRSKSGSRTRPGSASKAA
jgi:transposase